MSSVEPIAVPSDKPRRRSVQFDNADVIIPSTKDPASPPPPSPEYQVSSRRRGSQLFNRLALQFPQIRTSYSRIYNIFHKYASQNTTSLTSSASGQEEALAETLGSAAVSQAATLEDVQSMISTLIPASVSSSFEPPLDITQVFSKRGATFPVSFSSFLPILVEDILLKSAQGDNHAGFQGPKEIMHYWDTVRGFCHIADAFEQIAAPTGDGRSVVDSSAMKHALFGASKKDGSASVELLEARFKELALDEQQFIEFDEFLLGLTRWIGLESADEEEDTTQYD